MLRKRPVSLLIIAVALIALLTGGALAQPVPEPPLVLVDGDIYLWSGATVTPITDSGYAFDPVISPDGARLAFVEYADITLELFDQEGGFGGGALPSEIRLYDFQTGILTPLTQQPPGASLDDPASETIVRGAPVWSPDGTALAWSELIYTSIGTEDYLVIYDDLTRTVTRVAALPPQAGMPAPLQIAWGETGIVAWSVSLNVNNEFVDLLLVFDRNGIQTHSLEVTPRGDDYINNFILADWNSEEFIATIFGSGEVVLYTPNEIGSTIAPGVLQRYNRLNPGGVGLSLFPEGGFGSPFVAEIADGSGVILPIGYEFSNVAVSPSGNRYAYGVEDGVIVTNGRGETLIPAPGEGFISGLTWGPTGWRIDATFTPASSEDAAGLAACDLTPRLTIGGEGYVLPGPANRMRIQPNTDSDILDNIPGEAFFFVLDGPVCAQGFVWWEVQFGDLFGWTAEGSDGEYYLAPAPAG